MALDPTARLPRTLPWPENVLRRLVFHPPSVLTTGCIDHLSGINAQGYHRIQRSYMTQMPCHIAVWEWLNGPVPDGLILDHLCEHKWCINPGHMEPVTDAENKRRGSSPAAINARKTHCWRGHPFSGDNLRVTPTGGRRCRTCDTEQRRLRTVRERLARQEARRTASDC